LADRGFGDHKLYELLATLGWDYVIRFRASIVVAPAVRQSTDNRTHRHHRHLLQSQRPGTFAPPS
jgi:hypothetical protein